jgi:LacI family transcriptional regulator
MSNVTTRPPPTSRPPKRATLRTISELTGLSQSTVSLSLRGGGALKEETRRIVAEAAERVGYVPDRAGVRLRTGKTNVLALVLDGANDSIDFASHLMQGIWDAIRATRYHMTVTPEFHAVRSVDAVRYIIDNRTADGIIMTHTTARDPRVQLMMERDFPFVTHGRTEFFSPHPFNDFHSEAFARMAVERLVEKGSQKLMLVIGGDRTNNYHNIVTTFTRTAARFGLETEIIDHLNDRTTPKEMRQFGMALRPEPGRPPGIVCDSELRAICIIGGMVGAGLELGRDVHFLCKQTADVISAVFPAVDTIEEDVYAAGLELARLLMRRIDGEPAEQLQTLGEPVPHWR